MYVAYNCNDIASMNLNISEDYLINVQNVTSL